MKIWSVLIDYDLCKFIEANLSNRLRITKNQPNRILFNTFLPIHLWVVFSKSHSSDFIMIIGPCTSVFITYLSTNLFHDSFDFLL